MDVKSKRRRVMAMGAAGVAAMALAIPAGGALAQSGQGSQDGNRGQQQGQQQQRPQQRPDGRDCPKDRQGGQRGGQSGTSAPAPGGAAMPDGTSGV